MMMMMTMMLIWCSLQWWRWWYDADCNDDNDYNDDADDDLRRSKLSPAGARTSISESQTAVTSNNIPDDDCDFNRDNVDNVSFFDVYTLGRANQGSQEPSENVHWFNWNWTKRYCGTCGLPQAFLTAEVVACPRLKFRGLGHNFWFW